MFNNSSSSSNNNNDSSPSSSSSSSSQEREKNKKTKKFVRVSTAGAHGTARHCNDRGSSRWTTEKKTSVKFNDNNNNHSIIIINNNTTKTSKILRKAERKNQEKHTVGCNRWRPGCARHRDKHGLMQAAKHTFATCSLLIHGCISSLPSLLLSFRPRLALITSFISFLLALHLS